MWALLGVDTSGLLDRFSGTQNWTRALATAADCSQCRRSLTPPAHNCGTSVWFLIRPQPAILPPPGYAPQHAIPNSEQLLYPSGCAAYFECLCSIGFVYKLSLWASWLNVSAHLSLTPWLAHPSSYSVAWGARWLLVPLKMDIVCCFQSHFLRKQWEQHSLYSTVKGTPAHNFHLGASNNIRALTRVGHN